ncbi:hypothetical protein CXB77_16775 [Chromatium okenii]|uniref:HEPN domain-containing protein n=2 Tax=Chromatium okenii TaxID=61644 RepID=A0A2S7XPN8_9GAMM|nr:hypothetical protein CXB77_16775 [Chromatium okenii]
MSLNKNASGGRRRYIGQAVKDGCYMSNHNAQAQALMIAGQRDDLTFHLLRESGKAPLESMGFHAQQASEKFIKAVLVIHGIIFERTHDLTVLAALCLAHDIRVPIGKNALRILNYFAVQFRYETCSVKMIEQSEMAAIVETLKSWAEQEIACFIKK